MNTSKQILGSLCFIVAGAWLLVVHAHPLVVLFLRASRRRAGTTDPLDAFPYPPDYFGPFGWETWWPFVVGIAGMLLGAVLIAASGVRRETADRFEIQRKDNREI